MKQYQVLVDPFRMRYYGVTIQRCLHGAGAQQREFERRDSAAWPGILSGARCGPDQRSGRYPPIVLKEVGATPVYIRDVADVRFGEEVRYGAMIKGGYTEAVGGIVMMVASGNAKEIVQRVKERVEEINSQGHAAGRLRDRSVLRPVGAGRRGGAHCQQSAGSKVSCSSSSFCSSSWETCGPALS